MNDLFDIFNSRNMKQFDYQQPLNNLNKEMIFNFLDRMKIYIRGLKIKNATKRKIKKDERQNMEVVIKS